MFPFVDIQEYEDAVSRANNVRKNYEGFTSAEIKRADATYKALGRLGNPMVGNFEKMVCANQIQYYPITSKDINNSKVVFGPHPTRLRGQAVRRTLKRMNSDRVEIQR